MKSVKLHILAIIGCVLFASATWAQATNVGTTHASSAICTNVLQCSGGR